MSYYGLYSYSKGGKKDVIDHQKYGYGRNDYACWARVGSMLAEYGKKMYTLRTEITGSSGKDEINKLELDKIVEYCLRKGNDAFFC